MMISVGDTLKKERERKGLSLKQIEKEIKIREKFLQALEDNNWNNFPSKIYISGLLKNYAKFLGLDTHKILAFFRRDYERTEEVHFKKRVSARHFTPQTRKYAVISIAILSFIFFSYFLYQLKLFLSPPTVKILSPAISIFRSVDSIHIVAKTEKEASITIFGDRVYPDKDGVFEYTFPLHDGKNDLVIEVIGANGKKTVVKKTYIKE